MRAKIPAPSGAAGYIIRRIGALITAIPTADGTIIRIDAKNEKDSFLFASTILFLAINDEIAGTSAVQNAAVIASGMCISVSTFESIPY